MILLYDVCDGMWESKGNFLMTMEDNDKIIQPTNDGKYNLDILCESCYDFGRSRQSSSVVVSKVQSQMSLEECKSWTCIILLGLRAKVQVKGLSIKD